jgi:uncharacterized protein (DUF433 family)
MGASRAWVCCQYGSFDRITIEPGKVNGQPCVRGMRNSVRRVLLALASTPDRATLLAHYPFLEDEDIRQRLEFAAAAVERGVREPVAAAG